MPTPLKTYDLLNGVDLILGGFDISGYGEDGAVEIEAAEDVATPSFSADGQATVSRTNNNALYVNITVRETSRSYRDLAGMWRTQENQTPIERLEFLLRDRINGDEVRDQYAAFLQVPTPSKAKAAGDRVFRLLLPNARSTMKLGSNIAV